MGWMQFGKIISDARKVLGISQKDLAAKIKKEDGETISAQYLNDIEHNRRNPPSEFIIQQLAKELKLSKDLLCLVAGTVPHDLQSAVSFAEPLKVEEALKAFRRTVKGKHG